MSYDKNYQTVDVAVLISSSYEAIGIYKDLTEDGYKYVQDMSGPLLTLGRIGDRAICIAPLIHEIGGAKVLCVEATSALVDWNMIRAWVVANIPNGTDIYDGPTNMIINFSHYGKKNENKL